MASHIDVSTSRLTSGTAVLSVVVSLIVGDVVWFAIGGVRFVCGAFAVDVLQDALDAIVPLDALVEEERELGNASQAQPPAELPAQERRCAFERLRGRLPRFRIAEGGVVDARQLKIRGH